VGLREKKQSWEEKAYKYSFRMFQTPLFSKIDLVLGDVLLFH
jgi:hypothetical protein